MNPNNNIKVSEWERYDPEQPLAAEKIPDLFMFLFRNYFKDNRPGDVIFEVKNKDNIPVIARKSSGTPREYREALIGSWRRGGLIKPGERFSINIIPVNKSRPGKLIIQSLKSRVEVVSRSKNKKKGEKESEAQKHSSFVTSSKTLSLARGDVYKRSSISDQSSVSS